MKHSIKACYRLINSHREKNRQMPEEIGFFLQFPPKKLKQKLNIKLIREKATDKAVVLIISILCMPKIISIYFRQ